MLSAGVEEYEFPARALARYRPSLGHSSESFLETAAAADNFTEVLGFVTNG